MKKCCMTREAFDDLMRKEGCIEHHTATVRGYISRRSKLYAVAEYSGKYGEGYTILKPNYASTRYSYITYYTK